PLLVRAQRAGEVLAKGRGNARADILDHGLGRGRRRVLRFRDRPLDERARPRAGVLDLRPAEPEPPLEERDRVARAPRLDLALVPVTRRIVARRVPEDAVGDALDERRPLARARLLG